MGGCFLQGKINFKNLRLNGQKHVSIISNSLTSTKSNTNKILIADALLFVTNYNLRELKAA